jgi:pyruvate/2-oxoglutarate dehydrogenase complex dihydrolipoamide acyltransferase (E2) component
MNSINNSNSDTFEHKSSVDISIAVATDNGLITPIVKNANNLSIPKIADTVRELAGRARQGKLKPDEYQGGSFSVSNLGMFGIKQFSAVINPPQVGILAVGGVESKFNIKNELENEISFTLSYDQRCVDTVNAMRFMKTLNYFIENPNILNEQTQTF